MSLDAISWPVGQPTSTSDSESAFGLTLENDSNWLVNWIGITLGDSSECSVRGVRGMTIHVTASGLNEVQSTAGNNPPQCNTENPF
jgi:hypothetical protein